MIEKYSLYYCYQTIGDVLIVNIESDMFPTSSKRVGDVEIIYSADKIIGYNIFNISKIIKIKMVGILYHPENVFIDIVNSILKNAGCDTLSYVLHSGFIVGEVKECFQLDKGYMAVISIGESMVSGLTKTELDINDKVVIAKVGTTLRNGKIVKEMIGEFGIADCFICSGKDVFYDESEKPLILDNDVEVGIDFFKTEVK